VPYETDRSPLIKIKCPLSFMRGPYWTGATTPSGMSDLVIVPHAHFFATS
jgi:hypothetical protein